MIKRVLTATVMALVIIGAHDRAFRASAQSGDSEFPEQLISEWETSRASNVGYVNPNNGSYAPPTANDSCGSASAKGGSRGCAIADRSR